MKKTVGILQIVAGATLLASGVLGLIAACMQSDRWD